MKSFPKLIQISRWLKEEHSDTQAAHFKCTNCYSIYYICDKDKWSYCPKCGVKAPMTFREIRQKIYFDNFGVNMRINGKFEHIKAPVFTFTMEVKNFFDDKWKSYDWFPVTHSHTFLKNYLIGYRNNLTGTRFRIIPSKPLNLP